MEVFLFIIAFVSVLYFGEKMLIKWLDVEKQHVSETKGRRVDRWGKGLIVAGFLCVLPFVVDNDLFFIYWMVYFTVLYGFQAILEWKYLKNSKQYVVTLSMLGVSVAFIYSFNYWFVA